MNLFKITIFGSKRGHFTVEWHYVVPDHELELPWIWESLWDRLIYDLKGHVFEADLTDRTWEAVTEWEQWGSWWTPESDQRPRRYLKLVSN